MFLQHITEIKTCKSHGWCTSIPCCKDVFYLKIELFLVFINQALISLLLHILGFSKSQRHFTKLWVKDKRGKSPLFYISSYSITAQDGNLVSLFKESQWSWTNTEYKELSKGERLKRRISNLFFWKPGFQLQSSRKCSHLFPGSLQFKLEAEDRVSHFYINFWAD